LTKLWNTWLAVITIPERCRKILIRAMAPDLAYDTAVRDALAASEGFLGIRGLFLIQDNMISACNLLTSSYPLSAQEIEQSVKAKMALEAFGSAGEPIC
jgi:hypothetical protein